MDRAKRQSQLVKRLRIEGGGGGTRFVTIDGIALGKLRQVPGTGRWQLELREGWRPYRVESGAPDAEYAEGWAVEEIADLLAMEEQARQQEQSGES